MKQHSAQEHELRRYLLGDLTPGERLAVEERLFLDEEYLQSMRAAEDELLDEYVYNDLTAGEREKVETRFLPQPGRREDLRLAQALRRYASSGPAAAESPDATPAGETPGPAPTRDLNWLSYLFGHRPALGFSFAALLLVLFAGLVWLVTKPASVPRREQAQEQNQRQPESAGRQQGPADNTGVNRNSTVGVGLPTPTPGETQLARTEGEERPTGQNARRPRQGRVPPPQLTPGPGRTLALLLAPGSGVRENGETNNLSIAPDVGAVTLQLALVERDDYRSYQASLLSGKQLMYTRAGLKSAPVGDVKVVPLAVPARLLRGQSYQVRLSGLTPEGRLQEIASYSFSIRMK